MCKSIQMQLQMKNLKQLMSESDLHKLINMNTDAVAIIGHAPINLLLSYRESIKQHLKRNYAKLCATHVLATNLLFGNNLQTHLGREKNI